MDNAWSDHLQRMEDLKEAVVLRKYQKSDAVTEYREEALSLFQGLTEKMRFNAIYSLWQSLT
jgi:preprotein translocase subunit SecA